MGGPHRFGGSARRSQSGEETSAFLAELRALGIHVFMEGDRVRCSVPAGALTAELRATLAERKAEIAMLLGSAAERAISVVPLSRGGSGRPFFAVPGHNGDVFCLARLAHRLRRRPFYALEPPGLQGNALPLERIEELAAHFVRDVVAIESHGPYLVGGYCAGGLVAFEMARQLRARGGEVLELVLFETTCPTAYRFEHRWSIRIRERVRDIARRIEGLSRLSTTEKTVFAFGKAAELPRRWMRVAKGIGPRADSTGPRPVYRPPGLHAQRQAGSPVAQATARAVRRYVPSLYDGHLHFFAASEESMRLGFGRQADWSAFARTLVIETGPIGCEGDAMLCEPWAEFFADRLECCLASAEARSPNRRREGDTRASDRA